MSDKIGIKINANKFTPEKFIEAVESFLSIVQGVGQNVAVRQITWIVEVAKGSTILRMRPDRPSRDSSMAVEAVSLGFRSLKSGIKTIPHGFTLKEMGALKTLAALTEADGVQSICVKNGGRWEDIPKSVIPIINSILTRESHITYGSIEGEVMAFSRRQAYICTIYDPIYRREIVCYLQKQEAKDKAIEGFSKEARVLAEGLIHYDKEGNPVSVAADSIRVFSPESELPSLEEVQSIYRLK